MNLQENIRKVLREETSKNDIFKQVLRMGFNDSFEMFGGYRNLFNVLGVKNEVDFMNLFKGLKKHETEGYYEDKNTDLILYRFEKGNNIFIYHDNFITVKCEIIQILSHLFNMSVAERYMFLKEWLKKNYNLEFTHLFSTCGSEELESFVQKLYFDVALKLFFSAFFIFIFFHNFTGMDHRVSYIEDILKEDFNEWHHKHMFFNIKDGAINITYIIPKTFPSGGLMFRRTARKRLEDFGLVQGVDFTISIEFI